MKKVKVILFILFFSLLINNVNAILLTGLNPKSVNNGNGWFNDESYWNNSGNVYTIVNYTGSYYEILLWNPVSETVITIAKSSYTVNDAVICPDGYLYVATTNGLFKSNYRDSTNVFWVNDTVTVFGDGKHPFSQLITSDVYALAYDSNYIYIAESSNKIYKLEYNVYDKIFLFNIGKRIIDLDVNDNNVYTLAQGDFDSKYYIYKNGNIIKTLIIGYSGAPHYGGIEVFTNTTYNVKIYVSWNNNGNIKNDVYSDDGIFIESFDLPSSILDKANNFYIGYQSNQGVQIYSTNAETFATVDKKQNPNFLPAELTYNQADIFSLYNTYPNNSNFEIGYTIDLTLTNDEYDILKDNYIWKIELLNPDNYKIADYLIKSVDCSGLLSKRCYKNQIIYFSPIQNWNSGTYSVYLYEINITTNNKGFLSMDSFEVTNQSSQTGITSNVDYSTMSLSDKVNYLLSNNYLWAIIIISICIGMLMQFGKSGLLLGSGIGIGFTYLMGFIPTWMLFLFVIIIILVFAMKTSEQFSEG